MIGTDWLALGLGLTLFIAIGLFGWALTRH
jgi:hypothetical protein